MAFTPTEGDDIAFLVGPGTLTLDFLGGVDALDMGTSRRVDFNITRGESGATKIDSTIASMSGASPSAKVGLHLTAKNLELIAWHDGRSTPAGYSPTVSSAAEVETLVLSDQARSAFELTHTTSNNTYTLNVNSVNPKNNVTSYTLLSIERLKFSDFSVALDLDGHAGQTAKILGAVFGVAELTNKVYAGIGLQLLDAGNTSYEALMQLALDVKLGVGASNAAVVNLLYTNVVGVAPSTTEAAPFIAQLESGQYTPATLAVMAADTSINTTHINLVGLFDTGLAYTPA